MTERPIITLGSFVVGELPFPLDYQFLDADGVPINLAGFVNASFNWGRYVLGQVVSPTTETATVTDAANGVATYTWDGDEFATPGTHAGQFFVNDGTTQFGSIMILWQVCLAVGVAPVV